MKVDFCTENDYDAIRDIFNDAILNTTALYEYNPRTPEFIKQWFCQKKSDNYPIVGAYRDKTLLGFATFGPFRNYPGFKYSIEHSVYVHNLYRGQRIAKVLLKEIIALATIQRYHTIIGAIDSLNSPSKNLHKGIGFTHCGTIMQAGFKFGKWLDLELYQLLLKTPSNPSDLSDLQ